MKLWQVSLHIAHKEARNGPKQRVQALVRLALAQPAWTHVMLRGENVLEAGRSAATHVYCRPLRVTVRGGGTAIDGHPLGVRHWMSTSKSTGSGSGSSVPGAPIVISGEGARDVANIAAPPQTSRRPLQSRMMRTHGDL